MAPCYEIEITVVYDKYPDETSWVLQGTEDDLGNSVVLETHTGATAAAYSSFTKLKCLEKGEHTFMISDSKADGMCCDFGEGRYSVTSSNGRLIAGGGAFERSESTMFSLPFDPVPSVMPSSSVFPSSALPSTAPTSSSYPSLSFLPSSSPSTSVAPSVTIETFFETDCDRQCYPQVAMHRSTAVVTRSYTDVQFFATTNSSFELITKIDISYRPVTAAINDGAAVTGSALENDGTGAAYVYERARNQTWSQMLRIRPSVLVKGAWFGYSVAIDGDLMVVGAPYDGNKSQGSAYVYRRNKMSWMIEVKLTPPNSSRKGGFGWSVSIKGTSIVVGCPYCGDGNEGAVYFFDFDSISSSWKSLRGTLENKDCNKEFGVLVRLTDDGGLLVRRGYDGSADGTVYYYAKQRSGEDYVLQQSIGFDKGATGGSQQSSELGHSLAVDGKTMAVSEFRGHDISRVIHFFVQKNNTWKEIVTIDEPTFDKYFGERVALLGNKTLIGSNKNVYPLQDYFNP